jgi:hypothetical protein
MISCRMTGVVCGIPSTFPIPGQYLPDAGVYLFHSRLHQSVHCCFTKTFDPFCKTGSWRLFSVTVPYITAITASYLDSRSIQNIIFQYKLHQVAAPVGQGLYILKSFLLIKNIHLPKVRIIFRAVCYKISNKNGLKHKSPVRGSYSIKYLSLR